MSILFRNSQKIVGVLPNSVARLAEFVLQEEGGSEKEVSILFVDDAEISQLNKKHLGRNAPTDVLAFPMSGGGPINLHPEILGDVVVSAERAVFYALSHGVKVADELSLYVVHGLLHLLGYDDVNGANARKMRRRQHRLLSEANRRGLIIKTK